MGHLAHSQGNGKEAERHYRFAIDAFEETGDLPNASTGMFNLALLYEDQGRLDEALPLLERVEEMFEQLRSPHTADVRLALEAVRLQTRLGRSFAVSRALTEVMKKVPQVRKLFILVWRVCEDLKARR